jgi:hypothetical protein
MKFEITKYQKAGFKLLLKHIKREYPFITELLPDYTWFEKYGTHIYFNIKFDLERFYKTTGTTPPKQYAEKPYLYSLLTNNGSYLMRYVDNELDDKFGSEYNKKVEHDLNMFYKHLPDYMRVSKYEGWDDSDFEKGDRNNIGIDFYKKWQAQKEAVDLGVGEWNPIFDPSKYYKED